MEPRWDGRQAAERRKTMDNAEIDNMVDRAAVISRLLAGYRTPGSAAALARELREIEARLDAAYMADAR